MTPKQAKYVRLLFTWDGVSSLENEYALQFSNGRTDVLENLTHSETQAIIAEFSERSPSPADKMKGKILSMMHEMRWELPNGKVDIPRLNAWLIKHTPYHKQFDRLKEAELPIVVSLFEKMYKSFLKAV